MNIGKRIKQARENLHFTQEYVANKVGVAIQTIYKYENEIVTNIPLDKLEKIADALDTTPAYLMGWDNKSKTLGNALPRPNTTKDYTTIPVIGNIAAGYDNFASENYDGDYVDVPDSFLKGHDKSDYFILRVKGDSMYPLYHDGDEVLILKQSTLNYSGQIGAILYDDDYATLKKVEYIDGENWLRLVPINPSVPPVFIEGDMLQHCRVLGIPKLLIRNIR